MKKLIKRILDDQLTFFSSIIYHTINIFNKDNQLKVKTIDETISKLLDNNYSIIRFGDADINLIEGESQKYQESSENLTDRLVECANSDFESLMIAIPDIFNGLSEIKPSGRRYWVKHLLFKRKSWQKVFTKKVYYNAFVTRLYIDSNLEYDIIEKRFDNIKRVWKDRDVVIIEGFQSRLGVGNDLFNNAKTIKRILCPNKNAFNKYNEILNAALLIDKDSLILVALGPTARPLVLDLFREGFQAIDIGHIDIEYEWFLRKTKTKTQIKNKYVNEVANYNVEDCNDKKYLEQIITRID